ncbi:MAG TPA: autotransporter-associated beta strand repeat-containing protein [Sphingopyxis sp.]|uniref:autotransporter-associated beta strand repeat-containing protein n=1 Tax=Sphingopyxis sp. TaxID=1908224 RepID=UPI002B58F9DF|nr:autotransporter-associated beta strand repeat-containing protein [Sphingopyxis sp.]HWW57263.1 autotransporter-associated beta strand repeat-containing protein [Sphingopyxis sp.]
MTVSSKPARSIRSGQSLSRRLLCGASLAAVLACGLPGVAHAEDRHWDANVTAVGSGGTGTWNLANLNWSPNGDGVSGPYVRPWENGTVDNAIFGGTAGTVTVAVPVTVGNITFNSAGYVLNGSTLTLAGPAPTITTNIGNSNVTINSTIAGSAGLVKAGGGGLILNGTNSFTGGITLNSGSLYAGSDAALGALSNNIVTAAGVQVRLSITGASTSRAVAIGDGGTLILEGSGAGSALISGNGAVRVAASGVTMSNDLNTYTGQTIFTGCNGTCSARFTSLRNLGEASSLGAPVTVDDGTIIFNQQSQYSDSLIYLGDGDTSNRNWDINGNGAVIRNQGTGTLSITGDIDVSAGSTFIADTANMELLGILSGGAYGFNGAAGNSVTLGGANTFVGQATIAGLVKAAVLADTGVASSLGAGSTIGLSAGTLSYTGTGDSSDRAWIIAGAGGISNDGTGALDLSGNTGFAPGGAVDSLTLGGSFTGENQFSGVISGVGSLISNGSGTWVIGGANNFTGTVTVTSGTLKVGNAAAFGPANGLIVNGGTLDLGGFDLVAPSLTGTGGTVALGAQTLTVEAKTAQVFGGSITGTGGLRKSGAGSLTLTGTNSYTGATTISGGLLKLDFSGAGGPGSNIISASSPLVLSGGTLEMTGAAGETNNQSFGGVTVSAGSNTVRAVNGAGGIVNLNLGAITRAGGLVNFVLPTGGAITTSNADGVLGGWATINGSDYAKVVGGGILAFDASDYTTKDNAADWVNGDIISDTANAANTPFFGTVNGNVQLGGLRYTAAANSVVTIGAGNTMGIDGTIIVAPSALATNQTINGGFLTGSSGGGTLGVQQNGTGVLIINSTIVDNGGATGFAKSGTGAARLNAANSYTGATTISGGRLDVAQLANGGVASGIGASSADAANLVIESGTLAYTGAVDAVTDRGITLVNGGAERAIQVDAARSVEFSGLVTSPDDAGLTKTGWGTLVLSNAANDYVGVTTITQSSAAGSSTLSVNTLSDGGVASGIGAASSDSANLVMSNGARLQYTGGTVAIDRGFTLAAGQGGIDVANAGATLTIGGVATGAGSFFKDGAGTLILSGTNTYTGDTIVNAGVLRAGSARAFGAGGRYITVNSGGTLDLGGFDISAAAVIGGGLIDLGGRTLTTGGGGGVFTGRITGTGGYTRTGGFTQTFSGCNNDYTGVTTLGGAVSIDCIANGGQASGIGASSSASSNLVFANGTLVYTGASVSTDRGFTMTGNGNVNVFDAGTTLEFSGNITGAGQLNKDGGGTLLLSGTNNTTGNLRVINGAVRAGSTTALRSGWVSLDDTAGVLLDLDGYDNNVLYLAGGGTTGGNVVLDTATLTITSGGSAAANFGGAISGSGGLIKSGGGFQRLSGCSSSYSGTTVINQGTLAVDCLGDGGANSSIGSSSSAAGNLVLSGGTLQYVGAGGATNRQFTLGASTTSKLDASGTGAIAFTHAGPLTFASANTAQTLTLGGASTANNILAAQITNNGTGVTRLTKTDAGTWILTNPGSTYTGITTISGGVLGVDKLADGGVASSIGASSAAAANLVIGNGSTLRYTGAGDSTNRLFTLSQGVTFIESSGTGAIVFTDTGPVTLAGSNQARTIALGGTNTGNNTLAGSIGNAGTGVTTLAKNDSGTWVLTGNHSYTGSTNINGGILSIGGGGTTGSVASAVVNNFGTLAFNRSDSLTYGGTIVGTGGVFQNGTGTTILTGTNSYTGGTTINAGTLQLGDGGAAGSIVGNVANDGLLVFNRSDLVNFAGIISGSGAVRQIGSGTTVLAGINSYAGGTSILGGTLQVSADANLGAAAGGLTFSNGTLRTTASFASARNASLTGAGTILTDTGTTVGLSGVVSGAGGLTKTGAGILTLGGNNSYSGATNVNAGTLRINGDQSAATGLVTVASGATLAGNGTIGGSVNVLNGGILAPGNSPGTLNINGDLALAGGSILNFEFGEAGVAGGALNDLVNVGGNLTLDGTINVTSSSGGYFGGGIYRVFNYAGSLVDNGLTLGSMPAGSDVTVQTSVAGQVNLVNSDGLALSFWDGSFGPKFDDVVSGGNGSWHLGGVENNWTGADGAINAAYADGTFAIFAGAPGTVAVDNGGGAVTTTGMQFATDGYLVNGGPLTLVGPESIIRVGDGTVAGAGYTARITANLTGATQLVKTDGGTLVLAGSNDYTGGTRIEGGTLRVSGDGNLGAAAGGLDFNGGTLNTTATMASGRNVTLTGAGTLQTDASTTLTLSGAITGGGTLAKSGGGTLLITGDATHGGGTTVAAGGRLQLGNGGTTGSIIGNIVNDGALAFNRSDDLGFAGAISGTGTLIQQGAGELTLTGSSSYTGATSVTAGTLLLQAGGQINGTSVLTVNGGGRMIVEGTGSRLAAGPGQSVIGQSGSSGAALIVRGGGVASFGQFDVGNGINTTGNVTVTGAGSQLSHSGSSYLGRFGTAIVNISDGGRMESNGAIVFVGGQATTSQGMVTVTGAGSVWAVGDRLDARRGLITVADGGVITAGSSVIGFNSGVGLNSPSADLVVTGAGSRFETIGGLAITNSSANGDRGTITIGDGGVVRVGGGTLAMGPGDATLYIGDFQSLPAGKRAGILDAAELTFAASTNVVNFNHIDSDYVFATRMSGAGEIIVSRGTTILTADNAHSGQTHVNGGMLIINGDQSAATGRVNVMAGGALGGRGVIGGSVDGFGRIAPGDLGAAPGTLTINGDLLTNFVTNFDFNFGQANVVGGAFNDLIEVGGNLTLDGTLNVTVSAGGSFDPGVYRVINYAGTLTNNGLDVDPGYFVQTSVANQVNLVNTTGLTMRFWDGVDGAKNDNVITGGDGLWQNSGGNDNWTEADGSANAPFTDDAFAVFSGVGGTVIVDDTLGAVTASGMQFASDGYVISGDDIGIVVPESVIRVGDGSTGGAGYTATIASNLTGIGDVIKSDLGTLVLTGTNSFAGETNVRGGELRLANGGTLTNAEGVIGRESGEQGTLTVIGTDGSNASTWTNAGILRVGRLGTGTLNILDGGIVTVADIAYIGEDVGSRGTVTVSGQDANGNASTWTGASDIVVGEFGNGTLNITAGGQVSNQSGWIGSNAGAQGVVNVSGVGTNGLASTWTNNADLYVGYDGNGTLNITDGGKVVSAGGQIGGNSDGLGEVLVSGAGSSWDNSGRINVGLFGTGTLRIENGATVTSNDGVIGASAQGDAVVSGAGTSWVNTQQLNVGSFGAGTLRIENGASVTSNQGYIGANDTGSVVVTGAGSNWLVTDFSMTVGNDGTGSLVIDNGGRVRGEGGFTLGSTAAASGTIAVLGTAANRGVLETSQIGGGLGTVNFSLDGGVLRATVDEGNFFTGFGARDIALGANGGFIDTNGHNIGIAPRFTGAGGLTKDGLGTLTLTGASSYAGATLVNAGTLLVNGDQSAATGLTTVVSGATLGGIGTIGGDVAILDGGMLSPGESAGTLNINGNLSLAGGSILNYEFGQAEVPGGPLNDLVNVGGNLTLDGTINVSVSAGGNFGGGLYRVFNYDGAFTDNGLTLGSMPVGSNVSVQTSVAGQVNLINSDGLALSFWDGDAGPKFNDAIDGGDGSWHLGGVDNNWTDADGSINAAYADGTYAIFAGAAGTVTVDNDGGAVTATGMQFATDGYVIDGAPLTLVGPDAVIRVGDGTAAGAGFTATIVAELTGASRLVKTDAGTLVLTGANSYTGGTTISDGTLQIGDGGFTGSIVGDIVNDGVLVIDRLDPYTLDGVISGSGSLVSNAAVLTLTGTNSYSGGTTINNGTVAISSDANLGDAAGTLSLRGSVLRADASFASDRAILLGGTSSNGIDVQGSEVTLSGIIGDGAGNLGGNFLDKRGSGTLTLTGANTYSNRTNILGGTLALAGAGTIGAGNLIVGSGTVFDISQTDAGARIVQLAGGATGRVALGSKTLTLGLTNSFTDWAGAITDGGIGGGTGGNVIITAAGGAVRYFGANSYTGGTTVAAGSFELVGNGSLYSAGAVTVNGGALFSIAGITAAGTTIGDLSGAGTVVLGGKTLTFGTANDTLFSGPISGNGGGLVKQGTGTFTLTGANSYTGATDVLAGTLLVNGDQSAATGLTSVASGATLGGFGTLGGDVTIADGATLAPGAGGPGALTINGNLALASGATLGFEFGQANNPGGPLNDVVNVGGNLVLDGTIDVAIAPGGSFDIGLYRVFNYGGALTDNGLALGAMPPGSNMLVQTAIDGEVNLINRGTATLNFWDGAAGPKFDGAVNGGDGIWQDSSGNDNWADISGAVNAGYDDGAFAIFSGAAGTVTIDNTPGAVSASGLQFATDGYRITGDALTLAGAQAVIRVGDGTVGGAAYVTTIDAEVTGTAQLVKTDAGTLVLAGNNSYSGGTLIDAGTIRISGDANLGAAAGGIAFDGGTLQAAGSIVSTRAVDLISGGTFLVDPAATLTLQGPVAGAGNLGKSGTGTLVLAGTGSHGGGTTVIAGTLLVNGDYSGATGATNVAGGATLGGTGVIGGDVALANGATLAPGAGAPGTLTIGGNLSLAAGTQLDFEFGEAGVAGGALNDLVNVGGNLTLDGTINVAVPAGGAFDVGVYRVFNYGGTLTNNGLSLGTLPAGANAIVQTSVAGQVNLVNSAGLTLNFWDGAAGPKNNGVINGGTGVWQNSTGNDNWTNASGAVNAAYSDGAFAVFGGTAGTVTVDDGLGEVSVAGMQFASDGYVIAGDGIALTAPQATIRVGDGSTAGAGYTATINSVLGGDAELVKTDGGTLVLGGANSYTGGTRIAGGTVRIASDANLGATTGGVTLDGGTLATSADLTSARAIEIAGVGTIATADATTFTFNGLFSGTGELTKAGAGTLSILGDNGGFGGSTTVAAGTLAVQGSLGGAVTVGSAGRLEGAGRVGSITNAGIVGPGTGIGTLTVAGNYAGNGGVLEIEAELGGDTSAADRLVVNGDTSGATAVTVLNRGGLGAQTVEGIKIVDVAGASNGTFVLNGDYLFDGQQAVIAGAYGYRLYKNGVATPQDGDWYLRSSLLNPTEPENPGPLYQPGVPVYESYLSTLQALGGLSTLQQRVGNRSWAGTPATAGSGIWGRMDSKRQRPESVFSTSGADRKVDSWQAQMGADALLVERGDGAALVGGINAHYGEADAGITSIFGDGTIHTKGYGLGATLTWYGPNGFYVDGQAKLSWFESDLESNVLGALAEGNEGKGQAFSLELGKRSQIGGNLTVTPQVQMTYTNIDFDRFADPAAADVSAGRGDSLKTRWGLSLDHQTSWAAASGDKRRTHFYAVVNLSYEWLDGARVDVSGTPIETRERRLWGELGVGGSYSWGGDRFTLYTELSSDTPVADFGEGYNMKGVAGLRMRF